MAVYDTPTVDVSDAVLLTAYKMRPDVSRLYCDAGNPHPETGEPWCPGWPDLQPGATLQVQMMKDWWLNAAGRPDDTPSLYGNSMAEWVRIELGIDPGTPPANPATKGATGKVTGASEDEGKWIKLLSGALVLGLFLFIGDKRKRVMAVPAAQYFAERYQVGSGRAGRGRRGGGLGL